MLKKAGGREQRTEGVIAFERRNITTFTRQTRPADFGRDVNTGNWWRGCIFPDQVTKTQTRSRNASQYINNAVYPPHPPCPPHPP
ncbi:MAG: hypothetical protein RMX68_019275 [Aulosira sp. ZfuVER01]|nr:hypothetical protein [Aulosira sp. ZfuVER01]MDZ8000562.1 hypothetical protein [Aulosira sp. DedVER01a]MDZ8056486.1 hypothetical protein [Aulosira sp. ZfuCHP01]